MSRDDLFEGLESPTPPPGLREAALRAGRAALTTAAAPDRWTALLHNRGLRVAWLTTVLLLAIAHARVSREPRIDVATARTVEPELYEVAHLSRVAENPPRAAAGFALEGGPL